MSLSPELLYSLVSSSKVSKSAVNCVADLPELRFHITLVEALHRVLGNEVPAQGGKGLGSGMLFIRSEFSVRKTGKLMGQGK